MSGLDELLEAAREVESADAARNRADERLLDAKVQLAKLLPHEHPYRMTMDLLAAAHRRIGELVASEPDVKPATFKPGDLVEIAPGEDYAGCRGTVLEDDGEDERLSVRWFCEHRNMQVGRPRRHDIRLVEGLE